LEEDRFLEYKRQLDIARVQTIFNGLLALGIALVSIGFAFLASALSIIYSSSVAVSEQDNTLGILSFMGLLAMIIGLVVVGFSILAPFRKFSTRIHELGS
jgi:hypothetical protein